MGAAATAVAVTGTGAVFALGTCTYRGLSLRDASGSANTVTVYDNPAAASGTVLATFVLDANASVLDNVDGGVRAATGLYLETTGAVIGSVRIG